MLSLITVFTLILLTSSATGAKSDEVTFEVEYKEGGGRMVVRKDAEGGRTTIYETDRKIPLGSPSLSPNGEYVVFIEVEDGVVEGGGYKIPPRNRMVVCDTGGTVIRRVDDDVRELSWSPDGRQLAYITGTFSEVKFQPEGAFVLDVEEGTRVRFGKDFPHESIEGCSGIGYAIYWTDHDGMIYIQDLRRCGGNWMYNPESGATQAVPYEGIHFSPDGAYYLAIRPEAGNRVYESATNRDITAEVRAAIGSIPYSWISDREHHFYGGSTEYVKDSAYATWHRTDDSGRPLFVVIPEGVLTVKERRVFVYDVDKKAVVEEWVEEP